jgi:hypothetical protein
MEHPNRSREVKKGIRALLSSYEFGTQSGPIKTKPMKRRVKWGRGKSESISCSLFHGPVVRKVFLDLEREIY